MHEWKNYYILCFTAVLLHFEDKDLITNELWDRILYCILYFRTVIFSSELGYIINFSSHTRVLFIFLDHILELP